MSAHVVLGEGHEFDAIRAMVAAWGARARGIGDDAAVLDVPPGAQLVVSVDTSVDAVHFRRDWLRADEIGWRATMAALSDLAAMGADPLGVLLAVTVPTADRASLPAIAAGVGEAVHAAGTVIVGGDISSGATLSITVTVLGAARRPLTRAGARVGDAVWVTGRLGGPSAALRAWQGGGAPTPEARARFATPGARLAAGRWLAAAGATAAIDISDGLVADARHIAAASAVTLTIDLATVPCLTGVDPVAAVQSGEEYELLVTAPATLDAAAFAVACGFPLTRIGQVVPGPTGVQVLSHRGRVDIAGGHDHFSS